MLEGKTKKRMKETEDLIHKYLSTFKCDEAFSTVVKTPDDSMT